MKHRKLRIAWSVAWGVLASMLIVLWLDSYWHLEGVRGTVESHAIGTETIPGGIRLWHIGPGAKPPAMPWEFIRGPMSEPVRHAVEQVDDDLHNLIGIRWLFVGSIWRVVLPFWLLLMICAVAVGIPGRQKRI